MTEPEYPEHEKMRAVMDDSRTIGAFLEWLQYSGYTICVWEDETPCRWQDWSLSRDIYCNGGTVYEDGEPTEETCSSCNGTGIVSRLEPCLAPAGLGIEKMLAKYFGIDLDKINIEKDAILASIREANRQ